MSQTPLISIIVPFLNAQQYLSEAIESVLAQTLQDWELLLVDDGSTDQSRAIAERAQAKRPAQIKVLEHPGQVNRGMSASRSLGARQARGTYIAYLDADDVWMANKLQRQVELLEAHPEAVMVYGPKLWWYSWTNRPQDAGRDTLQDVDVPMDALVPPGELTRVLLRNAAAVPAPSGVLIRHEALRRVGGPEDNFRTMYEDQALYAKLNLSGPVYVTQDCLYRYRQHGGQYSDAAWLRTDNLYLRPVYLHWLQEYITRQGVEAPQLLALVKEQLRCYQHPVRFGLECFRHFAGQWRRRLTGNSWRPASKRNASLAATQGLKVQESHQ